ncbi:uncharacterized protein RCC_00228 [Ramularia collo-cygni]|uniref:Uncharacterized protein n=1 Tax=Ramularia collo-cygni TaxID=112498 RepID=A0A2D3V200_9PEZI|nr:uncharacterized protein RCC_00228 [Ramularia collo-cygni]CZT14253.1 uncharacterized protein RCC_00228 [Ramularia collo-cygni]
MAPLVSPLAQSESKLKLFQRLGLDPKDRVHKRVYALMKLEAAGARKRLLESQEHSTAQIHEAAWRREVLRIYDEACVETKAVYRFGHDTENSMEPDNWIIRWLLWQYRDHRNKGRATSTSAASSHSSSYGDDNHDSDITTNGARVENQEEGTHPKSTTSAAPNHSSQYWDPVRERWQR